VIAMLTGLGARAWGYIVAAAAVVGGLLVILGRARKAGGDAVRVEQAAKRDQNREVRDAVERDTVRQPDGAAAGKLRDKWARD
jgi:hypothetical protein